jgi:hypothetical protein
MLLASGPLIAHGSLLAKGGWAVARPNAKMKSECGLRYRPATSRRIAEPWSGLFMNDLSSRLANLQGLSSESTERPILTALIVRIIAVLQALAVRAVGRGVRASTGPGDQALPVMNRMESACGLIQPTPRRISNAPTESRGSHGQN